VRNGKYGRDADRQGTGASSPRPTVREESGRGCARPSEAEDMGWLGHHVARDSGASARLEASAFHEMHARHDNAALPAEERRVGACRHGRIVASCLSRATPVEFLPNLEVSFLEHVYNFDSPQLVTGDANGEEGEKEKDQKEIREMKAEALA
jgi:hypothetical protein